MTTLRTQIENAIGTSINEDRTVTVRVQNIDAALSAIEEVSADDDGEVEYTDTHDKETDEPIREVCNTGTPGWRIQLRKAA
jgi:hypothetical protein